MTPKDFATRYAPQAETVGAATGLRPVVLLAQWGVETGYATSWAGAPNNLGNIRCSPVTFCQYASLSDFCDAAVVTWHNGLYSAVLATAGQGQTTQAEAIGASLWDSGHYVGLPPYNYVGGSIIQALGEIQMGTVADLPEGWLGDVNLRQASFLGITAGDVAPITVQQLMDAIGKIQQPPPATVDLQPVLDAIAKLQADLDSLTLKKL